MRLPYIEQVINRNVCSFHNTDGGSLEHTHSCDVLTKCHPSNEPWFRNSGKWILHRDRRVEIRLRTLTGRYQCEHIRIHRTVCRCPDGSKFKCFPTCPHPNDSPNRRSRRLLFPAPDISEHPGSHLPCLPGHSSG